MPYSKITTDDVRVIRERAKKGDKYTAIAGDFGLGRGHVIKIATGWSWSNLNNDYPPVISKRRKRLSDAEVIDIRERYHKRETIESIAEMYNVSPDIAHRAAIGITHHWLNHNHPPISNRRKGVKRIYQLYFEESERELAKHIADDPSLLDNTLIRNLWAKVTTTHKDLLDLG